MPDSSASFGTLLALLVFITASIWLGTVAQRAVRRGAFLKGYFLGNRGLGAWTLALTATVQSGGTFMGFPSLVYSHGWAVALWICGYMVVPITGFGVLGKRFAQLSRRTGAITMPDLFRARFDSPQVGLVSSLLILFFLTSMMIAQFKAGALVMKVAWPGSGALALAESSDALDRYYYMGLTIFALTVVGYTVIGGFLAAVWTDLFQSVLMLAGVMILLPLALIAAGGLEDASIAAARNAGPQYLIPPGYPPERNFLPPGLASHSSLYGCLPGWDLRPAWCGSWPARTPPRSAARSSCSARTTC
jgi:SSS family solute:Na+ symporter/sodium/pantothenate symporter